MSKALKVLAIVGAFLLIDAVVPRPGWAPAPLVTKRDVLVSLRLAAPEPPPAAVAEQDHSEDEAATLVATEQTPDFPPTPSAAADAGQSVVDATAATDGGQPVAQEVAPEVVKKPTVHLKTPTKPFIATTEAGWDDFRARLAELEAGKRKKVRIVQLGDSEIAGDDVTRTLRKQFSRKYGSGGLGFVLAFKPWNWYAREGYDLHSPGAFSAHGFVLGKSSDGDYGPGGFAFDVAKAGAVAKIGLTDPPEGGCRVGFHYEVGPGGGELEISADDKVVGTVQTAAEARKPTVQQFDFNECPSELAAKTKSEAHVRIFGWSVESNRPGIVWSSLGVVAANAMHLRNYSGNQLVEALKTLDPDLIVLGYGLNLVHSPAPPPTIERSAFKQVMLSLRAGLAGARCLAMSPYPVAVSEDGALVPSPSLPILARFQREAAADAGCAFLDREVLSGGPETALKWLDAKPRILSGDYTHLTSIGAEKMGQELARVLLNEKPEAL